MNRDYKEVAEGLEKLRCMEDTAIVVEGINDKKALKTLSVGAENIVTWIGTAEDIAVNLERKGYHKAVILTDFDDEGIRKEKELRSVFTYRGIKVDTSVRTYFQKTFRVMCIEDMIYYSRRGYIADL